jgi:hypothetical protein
VLFEEEDRDVRRVLCWISRKGVLEGQLLGVLRSAHRSRDVDDVDLVRTVLGACVMLTAPMSAAAAHALATPLLPPAAMADRARKKARTRAERRALQVARARGSAGAAAKVRAPA